MERRLAEIHITSARRKALRLFAFAGAVYPGEWGGAYTEEIVPELFEFAFHARRVNQLCGLEDFEFPSIQKFVVRITERDPGNWEEKYQYALNRLCHVKSFVFGNVHADHRKLFSSAASNLMPLYVRVETDQRKFASISIFGVAFCFLSEVIPEVKKRFPDFKF